MSCATLGADRASCSCGGTSLQSHIAIRLPVIFPCCLCQSKSYHLSCEESLLHSSHLVMKENSDSVERVDNTQQENVNIWPFC